jgi:serine/threonine protein kinase
MEPDPSNMVLSNSPTLVSASLPGVIMGTAAYMSPEQAKGRTVDRRTDIFAFGCGLYEMLTGKPAFDGEDLAEILSRVLQREPDWTLLPRNVPPSVQQLLRQCVERNVKNRRRDAGDVRIDIERVLAGVGPRSAGHRKRVPALCMGCDRCCRFAGYCVCCSGDSPLDGSSATGAG